MATIDNIAELLRQQEELDRAMNHGREALDVDERKRNGQVRKLGSFSNVMRDAFQAAPRMRRRATDVR